MVQPFVLKQEGEAIYNDERDFSEGMERRIRIIITIIIINIILSPHTDTWEKQKGLLEQTRTL